MEAVILDTRLDVPFVNFMESYNEGVTFARIDSAVTDMLKSDEEETLDTEALEKLFKETLGKDDLKIKVQKLVSADVSAMIEESEQSRRMQEMSIMYGMANMAMPSDETLVLNTGNNVVKLLLDIKDDSEKKEETQLLCKQIYDLAMMSHKPLNNEAMTEFIARSNKIMEMLAKK
jgi:molecular chaperone HtpG